jgi:hypothetical protein
MGSNSNNKISWQEIWNLNIRGGYIFDGKVSERQKIASYTSRVIETPDSREAVIYISHYLSHFTQVKLKYV